jgi:hypothetical protein
MKKQITTHTPNTIKKLVELPTETAEGLQDLAKKKGTTTKPYMEQVLIAHEQKNNKK